MDDRRERRRAVVLAGHLGDHEGKARGGLRDPEPSIRAASLSALARLSSLLDDDLRLALVDPEPSVRRVAIEAAVADAAVGLVVLLDDPDDRVVEVAAYACGERSPAEAGAVEALSRVATTSGDALVREAAVAALGAIGDEAGRAAVLAATTDRAAVRRRAVLALAAFEGPEVDEALATAASDQDWQVRQAAEDAGAPSSATPSSTAPSSTAPASASSSTSQETTLAPPRL